MARRLVLSILLGAGLLLPAASAHATFPGANGKIAYSHCEDSNCNSLHVWSMNPDGSGQAQLTTLTTSDNDPAYSADGRRLAFEYCTDNGINGCGIAIVNADGSGQQALTPSDGGFFDDYPAFTLDGSKIVFVRDGTLEVIPAAGGTPTALPGSSSDNQPAVSPDGTKIAFNHQGQIWIMGIDGTGRTQITTPPSGAGDGSPNFSPDGTKIAFERDNADSSRSIEVMAASGGAPVAIYTSPVNANGGQPEFSPDGTKIVFEECDGSSCSEGIKVINADGSGTVQTLTTGLGGGDFRPAWQPVAPILGGAPAVTGTAVNGQTLSAAAAPVSGATSSSFQWLRCDKSGNGCVPITGATAATYKLTSADIGHTFRVRQTSVNAVGPVSSDSSPTKAVTPNPKRCSNLFTGTRLRDFFAGTAGGDKIFGGAGNDHLAGGPGSDCISGGSGNDKITGGTGSDTLSGGSGRDKISGGPGNDHISGGSGNDTISAGSGSNVVSGGSGNDRINVVNGKRDRVNCGSGHKDVVHADAKDRLRGCERVLIVRRHRSKHHKR